jgi:hypothetical protein
LFGARIFVTDGLLKTSPKTAHMIGFCCVVQAGFNSLSIQRICHVNPISRVETMHPRTPSVPLVWFDLLLCVHVRFGGCKHGKSFVVQMQNWLLALGVLNTK